MQVSPIDVDHHSLFINSQPTCKSAKDYFIQIRKVETEGSKLHFLLLYISNDLGSGFVIGISNQTDDHPFEQLADVVVIKLDNQLRVSAVRFANSDS